MADNSNRKLTEAEVKAYVKSGYSKCPFPGCESTDFDCGSVEIDSNYATQDCMCLECHGSWQDVYTLTGANNLS